MRKISLLVIGIITFLFINQSNVLAATVSDGAEQTTGFLKTLGSLFSQEVLLNLIFAVFTIFMTFFVSKIIRDKLFLYLEKKVSDNESGTEMVGVATRTVNVIVLVTGFSVALGILGVDLTIFVGGIGFGIGFTLKTFLTNFITGIILITQNTYHNGDLIEINGEMGTLVKINTLFTSIRKFDGVMFYVPNINFIEEKVYNFTSNDKRRVDIEVLVDYNSDIHKAKTIITKVGENFPTILKAPAVDVLVDKMADSGILLKARFWMASKDNYFHLKSNLTETINLAFKQHGIKIAYPHLHISTINMEGVTDNIKDMPKSV